MSNNSVAVAAGDPGVDLWWVMVVQGIATILFGIVALFWPGLTLTVLVYLFGAFILVVGITDLIGGVMRISRGGWGWFVQLLLGVLGIGVGIYLIRHPLATFATIILLIGLVMIVRGLIDIVMAFLSGDKRGSTRVLMGIGGLLGIIVGALILGSPVAGGLAFVWLIGLYAIIVGVLMFALGLEAKKFTEVE
jgi:uncharacterized membrane protein HdeD (DUF308 family)